MNEEVIKNYERDLRFFCRLAADSQIDANEWSSGDKAAICWAARDAFKLAADQMFYRLEALRPGVYHVTSIYGRQQFINDQVQRIIKEKTDHEQKTQPLS